MKAKNEVVVVIPVYQEIVDPDEWISIRQCNKFLSGYSIVAVVPESLNVQFLLESIQGLRVERFADEYFKSIAGYNKLMLSSLFYKRFVEFNYLLIYQLDSIVLSDQLAYWCAQDYDYIGAPWVDESNPGHEYFIGVGNGGISLRKVSTFIDVLEHGTFHPDENAFCDLTVRSGLRELLLIWLMGRFSVLAKRLGRFFSWGNNSRCFLFFQDKNEDRFWSYHARFFSEGYKAPSPHDALGFAFECAPEFCLKENDQKLPFAVHAWKRYGHAFWLKHIEDDKDA